MCGDDTIRQKPYTVQILNGSITVPRFGVIFDVVSFFSGLGDMGNYRGVKFVGQSPDIS